MYNLLTKLLVSSAVVIAHQCNIITQTVTVTITVTITNPVMTNSVMTNSVMTNSVMTNSVINSVVPTITCSWDGHCLGDTCVTYDDCDGNLICLNGLCSSDSTSTISDSTSTTIPVNSGSIPISSGNKATLTTFDDTVFQCISGKPPINALAINPLLLGFTVDQWINLYANADPSIIPWCGKTLTVSVNNESFIGVIIDTCDPSGNTFTDPNTGKMIGGQCDYVDVLDLYGETGLAFLKKISNGDDFYQGTVNWMIT